MLDETLRRVATALHDLHVPFALIGAMAVGARGPVRATKDVAFLIDWPLDDGPKLAQSLAAKGLPCTFHRGPFDDPVAGVIRASGTEAGTSIAKWDILFPKKIWQQEAVARAKEVDMAGFILPVAQADDLFLMKLHAGGPQDLLDAAQLLKLQTNGERRQWKDRAAKIGRSRMYERCLKFIAEGI